jgi:hypothetical protein
VLSSREGRGGQLTFSPDERPRLLQAHPARSVRCGCPAHPSQLCPSSASTAGGQADRPSWQQARTPWSRPFCGVCHPLATAAVNHPLTAEFSFLCSRPGTRSARHRWPLRGEHVHLCPCVVLAPCLLLRFLPSPLRAFAATAAVFSPLFHLTVSSGWWAPQLLGRL